jgi:hypothetical protein
MSGPLLFDRVKETTTTTGAGTVTLAGAAAGYQSFAAVGDGNTCFYCIAHQSASEWETGIGTYTASGTTLARTTVLASSNAGAAVNFSAGTKDVFLTMPAASLSPLMVYAAAELSITGATTATLDRMHVCSGTTADYTVTLPAASGNAGRYLGFRMSGALTKLVTLDGNSAETIDGSATRVLWAGESAILLCDGSNWFKVAGKTIPMMCRLQRNSAQTLTQNVATKIDLNTTIIDVGSLGDTATGHVINIRRAGIYRVSGALTIPSVFNSGTRLLVDLYQNGTGGTRIVLGMKLSSAASQTLDASADAVYTFAAGDFVELVAEQTTASGQNTSTTDAFEPHLTVVELPTW